VKDSAGKEYHYPDLSTRHMGASVDYINHAIGLNLQAREMTKLLAKMGISAHVANNEQTIDVTIPPTRSDIIHECDVM